MSIVISIIGAIFAIFSVVIIHECGHFFMARWMGVRVLRFSIGFGKALWSHTSKAGTEYVIAMLPLGGYVRMLGEGDDAPPEELLRYAYNHKPLLARMAIVLAGPFMNFALAILLFWIIFLGGITQVKPVVGSVMPRSIAAQAGLQSGDWVQRINGVKTPSWQSVIMQLMTHMGSRGHMPMTVETPQGATKQRHLSLKDWTIRKQQPDLLKTLGIRPYQPAFPPVVARVLKNSPAERGGLKPGDRIIAVNGVKKTNMLAVIREIRANANREIFLTVQRAQRTLKLVMKSEAGMLGFMAHPPRWPERMLHTQTFSALSAWRPAVEQTWVLTRFNAVVLAKMIAGTISLRTLGGPISIFQIAGKASRHHYRVYLNFIAFISVTLGFINLLPVPGLDGGHFLFQMVEMVVRRRVPERIQVAAVKFGILLLILLMLVATFNDLQRLLR